MCGFTAFPLLIAKGWQKSCRNLKYLIFRRLDGFGYLRLLLYLCSTERETPVRRLTKKQFMLTKSISYLKLAWRYIKGICSFRHIEYDLKFVYDENMWYIDMPWPGDRYNLAMVAGSNHLLTYLDTPQKENHVRVLVRPSKTRISNLDGYFECVKQYSGLFAGATYKVNGLPDFTREIWICPVTLTVLGHYPNFIYIKQI